MASSVPGLASRVSYRNVRAGHVGWSRRPVRLSATNAATQEARGPLARTQRKRSKRTRLGRGEVAPLDVRARHHGREVLYGGGGV